MKTEFVDVNETRKNLRVEIPSNVVDAEIDKVARDYSKARGFPASGPARCRPGRQAALQGPDPPRRRARPDSARGRRGAARARRRAGRHARHPRRRRRGGPAADVHGVVRHGAGVRAGRLRRDLSCARRRPRVEDEAVDAGAAAAARARGALRAGRRTRRRARRHGRDRSDPDGCRRRRRGGRRGRRRQADSTRTSRVELGAQANPPGFDEQLLGLDGRRDQDVRRCTIPPTTRSRSWPDTTVTYTVTVKAIRKRRRARSSTTSSRRTSASSRRSTRCGAGARGPRARSAAREPSARCAAELMKQLAARVPFEVPASLVDREIDRRLEEFVRRLIDQHIDPRQAGHRLGRVPREPARGGARSGRGALVLDEVARREQLDGRPRRRSTRRSSGTRSGRAGRRRRCAPRSRRKAGCRASVRGAAAGEVD